MPCLGSSEEPGLASEEGGAWPRFRSRRSLASLRRPEEKEELGLASEGSEDWPRLTRRSLASPQKEEPGLTRRISSLAWLRGPEEKEEPRLAFLGSEYVGGAWSRFRRRRSLASPQKKEELGLARFGGRKSLASPRIQEKNKEPGLAVGKRMKSLPRLKARLALLREQGGAWPREGGRLRKRRSLASLRRPEDKEEPGLALEGSENSGGAWPRFRRRRSLASPQKKEELGFASEAGRAWPRLEKNKEPGKRMRSLPRLNERLALPREQGGAWPREGGA